jgi:hypothetical protein
VVKHLSLETLIRRVRASVKASEAFLESFLDNCFPQYFFMKQHVEMGVL